MQRNTSIAAIALAIGLLAAVPARAQSTATLQGTVTDAQSAVMPGVSVTIKNMATGTERVVITSVTGEYVAASLAPGHYQFLWPTVAGLTAGGIALGYFRIPVWPSGLCFALCGFVVGTILQEFYKGAAIRSRNSGTDLFTALVGLV